MKFNKKWTKYDNNFYLKLKKEGKSRDEIIKIMSMNELKNHPKSWFYRFCR